MDPDDLADFLADIDEVLVEVPLVEVPLVEVPIVEVPLVEVPIVELPVVEPLTLLEEEYARRRQIAQGRRVLARVQEVPAPFNPTLQQSREMRNLAAANQPGRNEQEGGRTVLFKTSLSAQRDQRELFKKARHNLAVGGMLDPLAMEPAAIGVAIEIEAPAMREEILILPDEAQQDKLCWICSEDDVVATCSSCNEGMCKDCIPNYATNGSLCPNCRAFDKFSSASRNIPEETRRLMRSNRADFEMSEFLRLAGLTSFVCPPCGTAVHLTEVELSLESGQFVECAMCAAKSCKKCKKVHDGARCRISLEERQTAAHLEVYSRTCEHCGDSCTRTEPGHSDAACASTLHYCTRAPGGCVVFCIAGTCRHSYATADPEAIHSRFAHMCTCQTLGFRHDGTLNSDFKCPICNKCRLYPSADAWALLLALAMQRGYVKDGEEVPESILADIARLTLGVVQTGEEAQAALDSDAAARQEAEQEQEQHWQALRLERLRLERLRERAPLLAYARAREADRQEHGRRVLAIALASHDAEPAAAVFAEPLVRPDPFEALMLSLGRQVPREAEPEAAPEAARYTDAQIATMSRRAAEMRAHELPPTEEQLRQRELAEDALYEANMAVMLHAREVQLSGRRRLAEAAALAAPLMGTSPSYSPFSSDEERAAYEADLVRAAPPPVHDEVDMTDNEEERRVRRRL